ncbi:hypothetical protein [Streptomyces sp. NPDC026092]|uniref:hypothetical protein n=1 Tax=Streptomyces sp. NPDC026092 TaxID=3154797 RepID=UPI0033EDAF19
MRSSSAECSSLSGAGVAQFGSGDPVESASIYFAGGLFFTIGGYTSLLQVLNAPRHSEGGGPLATVGWRWWGYEPMRLDWLSTFVQFAGTLVFGVNLLDSFLQGLTVQQTNRLIWTPDVIGCVLFLVSGHLAFAEICHRSRPCIRSRSLGWWVVAVNQFGSVLFIGREYLRFETELAKLSEGEGGRLAGETGRVTIPRPRAWEYESWTDDLERAVVALSHQNFAFADDLLRRWSSGYQPSEPDERGTYLLARSVALQGDLKRDQGAVVGPLSTQRCYANTRSLYTELEIPRRVAQLDLSLAVVTEMSGALETAARQYEDLAIDERLSPRDRARARLWVGTALSKDGNHDYAVRVMEEAIHEFEGLAEQDDWSVARQKLALAHRGTGNLDAALRLIDVARTTGINDAPMQRVRLDTAYGHILLSDRATLDDGLRVLDDAAKRAA